MNKFKCLYCGSEGKLIFSKYVKCEDTVIFYEDNHIEYDQHIDDNDVLGAEHRFICGACKRPVMFYGDYMTTEEELVALLNLTAEELAEMQADYEPTEDQLLSDEQGTIFTDPEN
jgi:hypothetical protein